MDQIIPVDNSVVIACEVPLKKLPEIIKPTEDIKKVGGYKIPFTSGKEGWDKWINTAREYTNKPLILDCQKLVPDPLKKVNMRNMESIKDSGFDAVIIFPLTGPISQYELIKSAQEIELRVIVGGEMTHHRFLIEDSSNPDEKDYTQIFGELGMAIDPTGYVRKATPEFIYEIAARMGITDFVVPGNKPEKLKEYKKLIESCGIENPAIYSPSFMKHSENIKESMKAVGKGFHPIIGRAIYEAKDIRQATLDITSKL